jgi:hypothetical protein
MLRARTNLKIVEQQDNSRHTFTTPRRDAPESCVYLSPP